MSEKKRDPFMGLDRQLLTGRRDPVQQSQDPQPKISQASEPPLSQETKSVNTHDSNQDSVISPDHLITIQAIRRAVRARGNEQSIHRLTNEEKRALKELVYNYDVEGTRTSENEITRIAINYLIVDHKQRGKDSVLAQVLAAINE